VWAQHIVWFFR